MECFQSFLLVGADGISSRSSGSCKQNATVFANAGTHRRRNRFLLHRSHMAAAHALLIFMLMPMLVVKLTVAAPADVDVVNVPPAVDTAAVAADHAEVANVEAAAGREASLTLNATSGENVLTQVKLEPMEANENVKVLEDSHFQSESIDQLEESIREAVRMEIESNRDASATNKLEMSIIGEQTKTKNDESHNVQNEGNDQSKSQEEDIVDKKPVAVESKLETRGPRNLDAVNEQLEHTVLESQSIDHENLEPHNIADTSESNDITDKTNLEQNIEEEPKPSEAVNKKKIPESTNDVTNNPEEQNNEISEGAVPEKAVQKEKDEPIADVLHIKEETTSELPVAEDVEKRVSKPEEEMPTSQDTNLLSKPETTNEVVQPKEFAVQTETTSLHPPEKAEIVDSTPTVPTDVEDGNKETTKLATVVSEANLLSIEDEIEHTSGQETTVMPELKDNQHQVFKKEGVDLENSKAAEEETRTGKVLLESPVERPIEVEDVEGTEQPQLINELGEKPQDNADVNSDVTAQPEAAVVLLETTTATENINTELLRDQNEDVPSSGEGRVETEDDKNSQNNISVAPESSSAAVSKENPSVVPVDNDAATAHKSSSSPKAGQTHQNILAGEDAALGDGKALPSSSGNDNMFDAVFETPTTTVKINTKLLEDQDEKVFSSEEGLVETEEDTEEDENSQKLISETLESSSAVPSKDSRSIVTVDNDAATAHKFFPPPNAGQTHQDNLAEEDTALGIGKALPSSSDSGNGFATNRSAMIIALCSFVAVMFIVVSLAMFLISFRRQHGTLDIEMQEQHCGKDDLDEEDAQLKLLDVELPPQVNVGSEETDECL